ncbi:hypothetical protein FRB98_008849 [Tulasnella sp. 332]|nr:hypothetical protein FRB98_008849 [Tulasnella sp. 332]
MHYVGACALHLLTWVLSSRTFEDTVDIWFRWQSSDGRASPHKKLTTWKGSQSLYKSIAAPLPSPLRVGEAWRLALWVALKPHATAPNRDPLTIELAPSMQAIPGSSMSCVEFGREVLPVISDPVLIEGPRKNSKDGFNKTDTKKVWDSGLGLSAWLAGLLYDSNPLETVPNELRTLLCSPEGFNAIELGTGIGVVSILLTALLTPWEAMPVRRILATDLGSALPLIEENRIANLLLAGPGVLAVSALAAASLDWNEPITACRALQDFGRVDFIILADVTYNQDMFPALLRTLTSILSGSQGSTAAKILMGYKERDPKERELWDLARASGIRFEQVGVVPGYAAPPVEIWLGGLIEDPCHS